ncbi:MAG: MFS transporter [Anaerolineae bacterium]|nr:MFS transporter [Anaerolineae bacterium]
MSKYIALLRNHPGFSLLWMAQVVSLLGDWFTTIVLSVLVVKYSPNNSGLAVSGLLLARFIPPMLISPIAGVLVDRFDRKLLLIMSNVLRAIVVLGFIATTHNADLLWLIYLLSVFQFILSAVFEPGQSALIPNLVPTESLVVANTLASVTWSVMLALGAVVGGVVGAVLGAEVALLIDSITFLVAALLIYQIKDYKGNAAAVSSDEHHQDDKSFREGLRFLRRRPGIASTLLVKFGSSLGNVDTLMTIYATQLFALNIWENVDGEQLALGIMYSAFGLGAILGPLVLNRLHDGSVPALRRMIVIGFLWVALAWVGLGLAQTLALVCLALVLRAMGGSVNWTYSSVIIQKSTPDAYLGRVFSMDMAAFYLATVTSTLIHGSLIDAVGVENARLVALGTVFIALIPLALWSYLVRWLAQRQQPVPAAGD